MGEERLPQRRVILGELVGGKGYSGGQEKDWMAHLKEDIYVGLWNEIRRVAKGCSEGRQMVSTSRGVEPSCSCGIGMKRRDTKLQSDAQRLRQRHPPSASLSGRGEGGGGKGERRGRMGEGKGGRHAQETEVWI